MDGLFGLLIACVLIRVIASWLGISSYAKWMRPIAFLTDWLLEPPAATDTAPRDVLTSAPWSPGCSSFSPAHSCWACCKSMPPVDEVPGGVRLTIHAQPRAALNQVVGLHGDAVKVRLTAPPVDGAANQALVQLLSMVLGVAPARVRPHRRKCGSAENRRNSRPDLRRRHEAARTLAVRYLMGYLR